MLSMKLWPLLYLIYTHIHLVTSQTTDTVCDSNSTTSFLFNKVGESPCQTWSKLQSLCIPESAFVNVPPLVDGTYGYNPPMEGSACQCNIAAYNLMHAVGEIGTSVWGSTEDRCQVGGDSTWSTQDMYSAGCATFVTEGLGFSQDSVQLPPFVWRTWDAARFVPALAAAAAPSFGTTSFPPAPSTLSRSFPAQQSTKSTSPSAIQSSTLAAPSSTNSAPGATDSPSPEHGHEKQDPGTPWVIILGSIGGAVAATITIAMLVFFFFLRRKRRNAEGQQELSSESADGQPMETGRRFDPSYHTSTDWKHKHRSFLDVLAITGSKEKRATGDSFFSPRTPPKPFALAHQQSQRRRKDSNDSIESLRYTTTSERLERDRTTSFGSGSEVSFGLGVGTPKVGVKYLKARDVTNISMASPMTARTDMTSTHLGPGGLLEAINTMKKEDADDPLITPSTIATAHRTEGDSYPFPPTPPFEKPLPRPSALKSRLSTKIPDSRFSSAVALPQPPVTPGYDFTLPPDEYRRKQYSVPRSITDDPRGSSALPSLYEPHPGATRYSVSQRTEYSKRHSRRVSRGAVSDDGESLIFSASTGHSSFVPDAQTIQRVKGMFGLNNIQFPLPPSTPRTRRKSGGSGSGSGDEKMSPAEWGKAKSKAKLTQEVMNIGKKDPIVERGNENRTRKGSI